MARKETMAERKYCKMKKKISIQNIAQLSSWTQLLVTNSLAVQQNALTKQLSSKARLPIDPCGNFIRLTPILHWTSKVHSSRWTRGSFQQKNTVSNNDKRTVSAVLLFLEINCCFHVPDSSVGSVSMLLGRKEIAVSTRP